jgi:hypothetical protein
MSPPTTLTHNQLDSAAPTFVACNFSAEVQVDSVVLARETVHLVKPLCITEVVAPVGCVCCQYSQRVRALRAQIASQGRHKVSIRNESRVSFRDAALPAHVLIFIVRKYQRTLRGIPVDRAIWQPRTFAPRTLRSLRLEVLNRKGPKDREENWKSDRGASLS